MSPSADTTPQAGTVTGRYDLHVHSTASDGLLRPRDVVALAVERGLAGVALTDHDTMAGCEEAAATAAMLGIGFVPGIELSCTLEGGPSMHLLGYFLDPGSDDLQGLLADMLEQRLERARDVVAMVQTVLPSFSMDDVLRQSQGAPPGRPHLARALVEAGLAADFAEAFGPDWLAPGGKAYVRRDAIPVGRAIDVIHRAGGAAVVAHPGARTRFGMNVEGIREAAALGLDGIEVDHPDHEGEHIRQATALAIELDLVQTSGSDDHGVGQDGPRLGCRTVPVRVVEQLRQRAGRS